MKINDFLIYELFNYFINLTKEKYLCHVFCISSDSLFIEKVYNEAMLDGRAKYVLVDDFDKNGKYEGIDYDKVINALSLFKKEYVIDEYKIDEDTKEFLVKRNILFLNPIEEILRPQSYLVWNAIKRVL